MLMLSEEISGDEQLHAKHQAFVFRSFCTLCDSRVLPPDLLRKQGRLVNELMFGITAQETAANKKAIKQRQTCGRPSHVEGRFAYVDGTKSTRPLKRMGKWKVGEEDDEAAHRKWARDKFRTPYIPPTLSRGLAR